MSETSEINGFKVVKLRISNTSTDPHHIFIKEHSVRQLDEEKPSGRTLFVLNIPPYTTDASLKTAFAKAGPIHSIFLEKNSDTAFKIGYIVFANHTGLLKALKLQTLEPLSPPLLTGLEKWIQDYNASICNHETLNKQIISFMTRYDQEEEAKKGGGEQVDDEGWTIVSKKGRNPGLSRKESVENKIIQKNRNKSKKRQLKNFYTFQLKEEKMKNIVALRKSFQESKEKVQAMKQMRNFKPL